MNTKGLIGIKYDVSSEIGHPSNDTVTSIALFIFIVGKFQCFLSNKITITGHRHHHSLSQSRILFRIMSDAIKLEMPILFFI